VSADRRQDHRKKLPDDFVVSLYPRDLTDNGQPITAVAADLTMGGIGIVVPEAFDPGLHCEIWAVTLILPDKAGRPVELTLDALITHGRPQGGGHFYGLKFTEINAPKRSAERATLRQFLLSDLRDQWQGNLVIDPPAAAAGSTARS
jgi:c-di-GMP-binding flagellar brake protein YcgR